MLLQRLGIGLASTRPVATQVRCAQAADAGGLDTYWHAESHHFRSATSLAAVTAQHTRRIQIGLGILNTHSRLPGLIAMEAATLWEVTGGRLILGLGTGRQAAERHGIAPTELRPARRMRECLTAVRRLLAGETLAGPGEFFGFADAGVRLGVETPLPVPIVMGAIGPQMLRLAGRLADGVVLDPTCSLEYVRWAVGVVRDAAVEAGRDPAAVEIGSYLVFSVDRDRQRARDAARLMTALYLSRVLPIMHELAGISEAEVERVRDALAQNDQAALARVITDEMLERVAVVGTVDDCLARLSAYADAGLSHAIFYDLLGPDLDEGLRLVVEEIYPRAVAGAARPRGS
jgi:5,10-methylenetetrahydromethanopterin reductase